MAFVDRLKDTGESYEQFLKRCRSLEDKAKYHLPENIKIAKEIKMLTAYDKKLEDIRSRSFEELDPDDEKHSREIMDLVGESQFFRYKKVGSRDMIVFEDDGVYFFEEVIDA